ncbi:MAG: hypothetical protein KDD49_04325 [Bacteroidetes bacterium]|nr:hypothetical protein [Bacteroidota bacterium]
MDSGETFEQQKQQLIANFHLEKLFSATDIHQIRITALRAHLEEEISNTKTKLAATQQNLQHLEVQQQLQQYSQQLSEGEPCPLCGATHHPNPLQNETLPTHLATTNAAKTAEEKRLELLENALKQVENIINEYKNTRTNFKQQQQELSTDLAQKAAAINEKSLLETAEKFQALDQQSKVALAEKQRIQEQISTLQKHFQQQKQNVEISRQQYSEAELAYQTLQKQEIFYTEKIIALATYRSATQNEILALQKTYQSAENELKKLSEKLQQLQQQSFVHQAEEKSLSANIQTLESKINTHKQSLEAAYQQLKITADQAENIFDKAQYLSEKSKVYQQLQYDIAKAKEAFATIETELNGNIISEEALQKQEAELTEKQHTFEALQKEIAVLENNIVLQTQKLREKETISAEYKTIEAKANRLTELRKYFAGKGMVNFVLSKYLQQLTYLANQRFLQLSNNALGLTLNAENNEFAICDYLNGGKSRSVQSLSGGQQFQVSLCLALALSDTVHQRKGNASNFFFLDEGFGSQDNESLQVIFKTLRNLRNENKIIGLISHVDALKEQMDTYVEIQRTEQGSQIFVNT